MARNRFRKKGMIFNYVLAVMALMIFIYAYINMTDKVDFFDKRVGEREFGVIRATIDSEFAFLYQDAAVELAANQAVYDVAQQGGVACRKYLGYSVWDVNDESCMPSEQGVISLLKQNFVKNLNQYLFSYNQISDLSLPANNHELFIRNDGNLIIEGYATKKVEAYIGRAGNSNPAGFSRKKQIWPIPVNSRIITCFGEIQTSASLEFFDGLELESHDGESVLAVGNGNVVSVCPEYVPKCSGYDNQDGNNIIIKHGDYYVRYGNLGQISVKMGSYVKQGDVVGKIAGSSPKFIIRVYSSFNFNEGKANIDPVCYLPEGDYIVRKDNINCKGFDC